MKELNLKESLRYEIHGKTFGAIIGYARCKRHAKRTYRRYYPTDKIMKIVIKKFGQL